MWNRSSYRSLADTVHMVLDMARVSSQLTLKASTVAVNSLCSDLQAWYCIQSGHVATSHSIASNSDTMHWQSALQMMLVLKRIADRPAYV